MTETLLSECDVAFKRYHTFIIVVAKKDEIGRQKHITYGYITVDKQLTKIPYDHAP